MSVPLIFQQKQNNIFFHIATIGNYQEVVDELVNLISKITLFSNIFVGIVGDGYVNLPNNYKILYRNSNLQSWEFPTLACIKDYCKNRNCNILYIHTKGVSAIPQLKEAANDWRQYMSYFCIEKADKCINFLKEYDIVGVEWAVDPVPHFCGNFWWATSQYINKLPEISFITKEENRIWTHIKYNAEFWVGMNKNAKLLVLFHTGIHNYQRHLYTYKRNRYIRESF